MSTPKILLVDDDQDFAQLMEFDLKKRGYEVIKAFNGEEGLVRALAENPALIVLDIKMPKMDGYTFVRRLKKDSATKDIPLIVLTSYEPMKDMFQMEGVSDYFVKSATMDKLFKVIKERLENAPPVSES
ncbi:MAG: response regulator [Candidatus Omnitrophica bacterium]|nr:response regulator [Candidatus Omnitrophota bacterium]